MVPRNRGRGAAIRERPSVLNLLGVEDEERVRQVYGINCDWLVAVKNTFDPTNLFRLNQNIKPTASKKTIQLQHVSKNPALGPLPHDKPMCSFNRICIKRPGIYERSRPTNSGTASRRSKDDQSLPDNSDWARHGVSHCTLTTLRNAGKMVTIALAKPAASTSPSASNSNGHLPPLRRATQPDGASRRARQLAKRAGIGNRSAHTRCGTPSLQAALQDSVGYRLVYRRNRCFTPNPRIAVKVLLKDVFGAAARQCLRR